MTKLRTAAVVVVLGVVLLLSGCTTSRYYRFYADDLQQQDKSNPQAVQCGHVDLVISGNGSADHINVGRFCKVEEGR